MAKKFSLKEEIICDFLVTEKRKEIWKIELELLQKLIDVCDKYHLQYFIMAGSLIGVVRHEGFIPWDDDIDVGMLREDYNKLLKIAENEFQDDIFFQTPYTDTLYRGHAQLRMNGTTAILPNELEYQYNQGIFLDIFPFDEYPNSKRAFWIQKFRCKFLTKIMSTYYRPKHESIKGKLFYYCLVKPIVSLFGFTTLYRHYEKVCSKYNGRGCGEMSNLSFIYGREKYVIKKSNLQEFKKAIFEDVEVIIPVKYDEILKRIYGDYMKFKKVSSTHGGVIFDPEKSYKDFIREYHEGKIDLEDYYLN